ncbi:MAG: sigma-70 family RNA polymerase sigma factor [Flavobacteriales bacterium]|nr:sigma-70 family RNA polymerase sigma factor [Flavobacteriales bacterium]
MTQEEFQNNVLPLKDKMFRFAFRFLQNKSDAEDTVQDVMLKLWEMDQQTSEVKNIEAWCMTMTRNKALDSLKKMNRTEKELDGVVYKAQSIETPLDQLERKEALKEVKRFLHSMPKPQQLVVELRDFQGKTYAEIAELLNMDMSSVKVNLHRARKKVRDEWQKQLEYGLQKRTS